MRWYFIGDSGLLRANQVRYCEHGTAGLPFERTEVTYCEQKLFGLPFERTEVTYCEQSLTGLPRG